MGVVGSDDVEFWGVGAGRAAGESGDLGDEGVVEKGLEHVIALGEGVRGRKLGLKTEETYHETGAADDDC